MTATFVRRASSWLTSRCFWVSHPNYKYLLWTFELLPLFSSSFPCGFLRRYRPKYVKSEETSVNESPDQFKLICLFVFNYNLISSIILVFDWVCLGSISCLSVSTYCFVYSTNMTVNLRSMSKINCGILSSATVLNDLKWSRLQTLWTSVIIWRHYINKSEYKGQR